MSLEQRYIDYLVHSIETQVGFLQEAGRLQHGDAEMIKGRVRQCSGAVQLHENPQPVRAIPPVPAKPSSLRSESELQPQPPKKLATALWDYSSSTQGDLTFSKGQILEIMREENEHWLYGRNQADGLEGLFPSNYVERLPDPEQAQRRPVPPPPPPQSSGMYYPQTSQQPPYAQQSQPPPMYGAVEKAPPPQPYYHHQQPPQPYMPPGQPYAAPPPPTVAQTPPEAKKERFGGLGKTMAHGAAGGVGFGLATEAVHSIF